MRSGEREAGAARGNLLPAHWLWWGQEQSWTLFCTIYQPLLLPEELNCIEKHQALIRAGQLGRKIYHPNYQPAKTSRRDGEGGWVSRWGCSRGGGFRAVTSGPRALPALSPLISSGSGRSGALLCLSGTLIVCLASPRRLEALILLGGRFSPPKGRGGRLGEVGALESGLWERFPPQS